jgi:uncharacterized protein
MTHFAEKISEKLGLHTWQVANVLTLLEEGSTIPFIARYRKEKTGGLADVSISEIEKLLKALQLLESRKEAVLKSIESQELLTDDIKEKILQAENLNQVEDIYLPYKPKRKTRAVAAREKGLEPLAKMIMSEKVSSLESVAGRFINKDISTAEDALQGARDIIAEWISEKEYIRKSLRRLFERQAMFSSRLVKGKEREGEKFTAYFDWNELACRAPSHRILAMFRGEQESILRLKVVPDLDEAVKLVERQSIRGNNEAAEQKRIAVVDAVKRLLFPSLENGLRNDLKAKADAEAIRVFAENLSQLLMAAPLGQKNILAIDPGFRTGCKVVCLDATGQLMNNDTIYPHPPQRETAMAVKKIKSLVNAYKIEAIAIGNGTAGRETEEIISRMRFDRDLIAVMVNESGASVYSASSVAREEFPEYDVTVRGAVSIGRRLMDPLAELVKIEPKAIGVGQYQHDVNQKLLEESLKQTVEFCVNRVGVDLNTASKELLTYVSGIGPKLAAEIVAYRNTNGTFQSREDLKKVKGMEEKAFEQSAGFLRIKNGANPLDASAVHPENYGLVELIMKKTSKSLDELIGNKKLLTSLNPRDFTSGVSGEFTVKDILSELEKPGRDPRQTFKQFAFRKDIRKITDIEAGMLLPAVVSNITDFGAFVDLGIKESGLIHKSQIAEAYVSKPSDHLSLNQTLTVKVLQVDVERKRIGLTLVGVEQ